LRRLLPLLLVTFLAGCTGWLRPLPVSDGEHVFLLLAGKRMNSPDPETYLYAPVSGKARRWRKVAAWSGAARSAALWRGHLWVLFNDNVCSYRLGEDGPERVATHRFKGDWRPSALAVHQDALYALACDGQYLTISRRNSPDEAWQWLEAPLELGRSTVQFRAAGSGGALWVLWRKRGPDGEVLPETFAAYYQEGKWQLAPARALGGREFFVCRDPAGSGLLVVTARGGGLRGKGGAVNLCRVTATGWSELKKLNIPPRELGSAILGVGITAMQGKPRAAPEADNLLIFIGRQAGVGIYGCQPGGSALPADWDELTILKLDLRGPEAMLGMLLAAAALVIGFGLGIAAVRRRRLYPLLPGQPRPAPLAARIGAWVIDNILVGLVFYAGLAVTPLPTGAVLQHSGLGFLLVVANRLLFCFYSAIFEARWGATPGKLAFALRVATMDGHRPTARAAVIRNLFRVFDEALIFPLPGLLMAVVSRHAQRLGDIFAKTVVSTARSVNEIAEDRHRKSDRFGLP
jgi:uncharacterized RDD family membrane protein YckC